MKEKLERISLFRDLIEVATVDGMKDQIEMDFLNQIGQMMGLTLEEQQSAWNLKRPKVYPANEMERIVQFQRIILMMHVDAKVSEAEITLVEHLGFKLGFNSETVRRVLEEMRKHPNGLIPSDVMLGLFKINHN